MSAVVRILPSGHEFVVEADESLLAAALRSGLALEFGCSNGSCGECKGLVTQGEGRPIRGILKTPNENPAFTIDKEKLSGIIEYECRFHL